MNPEAHFRATAPAYMRRLLDEFPELGEIDAAAVFGNAGHESKGLTDDQEDRPVVKGSRGGGNWMQWTGPRRKALEAFAKAQGLDKDGDEVAFRFLVEELRGPEKAALGALRRATTLKGKTEAFCKKFLRPGVPHYASRLRWAQIALEALRGGKLPELPELGPEVTPELITQIQQALLDKGYTEIGRVDGRYGRKTYKAIRAFEDDRGLPLTGVPSVKILAHLLAAAPVPQPEARTEATPKDVREQVPEVKATWWTKVTSLAVLVVSGMTTAAGVAVDWIGGLFGFVGEAREFLRPVLDTFADVPWWAYAAAVGGVALWLWLQSRKGEAAAVAAFQSGERR